MPKLAHVLITLPLLVAPLLSVTLKPAAAETVSRSEAVELLAKAKAADAKCGVLSEDDRQELSDYLARAEVVAAQRGSAAAASAAVSTGKASGEASLCGADSATEVEATLAAARQAMAAVKQQQKDRDMESAATVRKRLAAKAAEARKKPKRAVEALSRADLQQFGQDGLGRYAGTAMAYYVERRCRHLSRSEAQQFWKLIVKQHKQALGQNSKAKVAAVLRGAEEKALSRACGGKTAALVRSTYSEIRTQ